jgi:hypothetical protein
MPEFPVAPNLTNTLALIERLPLLESPADALTFSTPTLMFVVYIPSKMGGVLRVGCTKPGARVVVETIDGKSITDLDGKAIAPSQTFVCPIPVNQYQWFMVLVGKVSGSYGMWATFAEIGTAREADNDSSDPLIPWNFWYFPYGGPGVNPDFTAWGSALLRPCQKYESDFEETGVFSWEKDHHDNADGKAQGWWGHCHNSAPASMIFKTPPAAGKKFNKETFLCEELKFFATEYFGRQGALDSVWGLPGTGPMGRSGFFQENKPSADPKKFGTLIGDFHRSLQNQILLKRLPLLMDLRDATGSDNSAVWNQAIYKYTAQMWETPASNNWLDITLKTTLNANDDRMNGNCSSTGVPANITPNPLGGGPDAVPAAGAIRRDQSLGYHLFFKEDGTLDSGNAKNEWSSVTLDSNGTDLHSPRFMFAPKKPAGNSSPDGNPNIVVSDVLLLLELRDRFK